MLLERIEAAEMGPTPWRLKFNPWFALDVERARWGRWKAMIPAMPIAATIRTRAGAVGLVHATPTTRHGDTMLAKLSAGDAAAMWTAISSTARARNDARRDERQRMAHRHRRGISERTPDPRPDRQRPHRDRDGPHRWTDSPYRNVLSRPRGPRPGPSAGERP